MLQEKEVAQPDPAAVAPFDKKIWQESSLLKLSNVEVCEVTTLVPVHPNSAELKVRFWKFIPHDDNNEELSSSSSSWVQVPEVSLPVCAMQPLGNCISFIDPKGVHYNPVEHPICVATSTEWFVLPSTYGMVTGATLFQKANNLTLVGDCRISHAKKVLRYNFQQQIWRFLPELTIPRFLSACCEVGLKSSSFLYVIGGGSGGRLFKRNFMPTAQMERCEIGRSVKWQMCAPMRVARYACAAVTFKNKIYVFGGCTSFGFQGETDSVEVYDPTQDKWNHDSAPMPYSRSQHCAIVSGDYILIVGGFSRVASSSLMCFIYDPLFNQWFNGPNCPFQGRLLPSQ